MCVCEINRERDGCHLLDRAGPTIPVFTILVPSNILVVFAEMTKQTHGCDKWIKYKNTKVCVCVCVISPRVHSLMIQKILWQDTSLVIYRLTEHLWPNFKTNFIFYFCFIKLWLTSQTISKNLSVFTPRNPNWLRVCVWQWREANKTPTWPPTISSTSGP